MVVVMAVITNQTWLVIIIILGKKMGILIQELVGKRYKNIFYPTFSGVSQSLNYYPVSYLKREQGIAFVAIGFGKTIVETMESGHK